MRVRKELIEVLGKQDKVVKLEGFSTEELNELLFNYVEEGDTKKKIFALPNSILQKIDMSNVSFNDFYAKNIDFGQFTGVRIDPNKLYNKSCFYTSFAGVTFLNGFRSGYIEGCNFTGSKNAVIGDRIKTRLNRCNGVLEAENSSIGKDVALGEKNVFKDVTFESPITKGNIVSSDFTGAHAKNGDKIKLDPFDLAESRVSGQIVRNVGECRFNGVKFTGSFGPIGDFAIRMADFTGSEGAVICPGSVFEKDYCYAKLSGVRFPAGSFIKDAQLEGTKFNGSEGAVISGPQQNMYVADLTDAAIRFNEPNDILYIHGVETAAYDKKAFCDVFNETLAREFEEPAKVYVKRIEKLGPKDKNQK
ncbi:unknown [Mycoplasma sp. CAG:877]|nr:unknown [Mycoplasma sp. CAG:877]